jgi:putative aminopeptidase FrvX
MEERALSFLEELCNAFGPSGFEGDPLRAVKSYTETYSDSIRQDRMGSVLFESVGDKSGPTIFIPGHVDEVGFIITGINDKGFLTFHNLGGWFDQVLLGQRVIVRTRTGDRDGIIASKPPHVIPPEERSKVIGMSKMFIDLGCSSTKEAEALGVRIGDPVVPRSAFSTFSKPVFGKQNGEDVENGTMALAMGKAFDDRIGAFIAAEVVRKLQAKDGPDHPNRVVGAATVQEEVGVRGATTAGWLAEPDVVIALEVDISGDVPGIEKHQAPAVMGKGPSVLAFDASMIPNQKLKELILDTADEQAIPCQISTMTRGGTDAGAVHKLRAGCPGVVIGVPTRHIHSHVGILSLDDVDWCIDLLVHVMTKLDAETVKGLTAL